MGEPRDNGRRDDFQREKLLRQRWRRWEEMILVLGVAVSMIASGLSHESVVTLVTRWFS